MASARHRALGAVRPGGFDFPVATATAFDAARCASRAWLMPQTQCQAGAFAALMLLQLSGTPLGGSATTLAACAAILLVGLPHGALDLEIIKRERNAGPSAMASVLMLYLGLAAAMAAVWLTVPVAALAIFLIVAVVHFAEDWHDLRSAFLAQGMAIAFLAAPTLLHLAELEHLFVALSGHNDGALVANVMLLVAPISIAIAAVSLRTLWHGGSHNEATVGVLTLAGMIVLPPVVGFALFFCLYHSPRHLKLAFARVGAAPQTFRPVLLITLAALGITAALFAGNVRSDLPAQVVAASFMTLSILTLPHMVVPALVDALAARRSNARDGLQH